MSQARKFLLAALLAALTGQASAAFDKGGVLGVGARPLGMGNAFVAVADESSAMMWNPAGMIQMNQMELSAFFGPLLNGKEYYVSGAFVMPFVEQTAMGLSVVSLYHDTGNANTRAYENTYILGFATPMNVEKTVSFGVNLKFLQYESQAKATLKNGQVIEARAGATGIDVGALYQIYMADYGKKMSIGFFGQDLSTTLNWQSGVEETVPLLLKAGFAYWPEENIIFAVDYSFFNDTNISGKALDKALLDCPAGVTDTTQCRSITTLEPQQHRPHVGLEGWFFDGHLGLRTGYSGFATTADRFTGGVSYKTGGYGVDYAYMGHAEHLGDSHRLSGHFNFGGTGERARVVALVNPPTNVTARPSNNQVNLVWEPNPDPYVTGYTLYMSKASGGNYVPIQKRLKENKVIVDGLTNGTRYYFVVTSVNNSWPSVESNYSTEISVVPAPQLPGALGLGGAASTPQSNVSCGEVLFTGLPVPGSGIAGYTLYMTETSGSGHKKVNDQLFKETSFLVPALEAGRTYYFQISQTTDGNPGVESARSREIPLVAKPCAQLPQTAPSPQDPNAAPAPGGAPPAAP